MCIILMDLSSIGFFIVLCIMISQINTELKFIKLHILNKINFSNLKCVYDRVKNTGYHLKIIFNIMQALSVE